MATSQTATLAPTSRARPAPTGDEETTSVLKLGEFTGITSLSLSEARAIINAVKNSRDKPGGRKINAGETFIKTQEYLESFARFKETNTTQAVERVLSAHPEFESFERSQLGSLCCDTAEEARTLIPSLEGKFSDDDLQEVLDEITKLRNFVE